MHSNSGRGKLPLLHVDDSANERSLVKVAISLTHVPFESYEANGLDAAIPFFQLADLKNPRPALVLLDYELGGHTGLDLLYWLRRIKKITELPVVMLSGSPGRDHVAECYAAGANHFLTKPKDLESLKRIIRALHIWVVSGESRVVTLLKEYQPNASTRPQPSRAE